MLTRASTQRAARQAAFATRVVVCLSASLAIATPALAAPPRDPVQSIQPLLVKAVQRGEAHGVLVGPAAEAIANQFASRAPIEVDVKVVSDLATAGCKRLHVDTHQDQVADRERATEPGKPGRPLPPKPMRLQYHISYCADGTFPPAQPARSAVDPARTPQATR